MSEITVHNPENEAVISDEQKRERIELFRRASAAEQNLMIGAEIFRTLKTNLEIRKQQATEGYHSPILTHLGVDVLTKEIPGMVDLKWTDMGEPQERRGQVPIGRVWKKRDETRITWDLFDYRDYGPPQWLKKIKPTQVNVDHRDVANVSVEQQQDAIVLNSIGFALEDLRQPKYSELGTDMLGGLSDHFKELAKRHPEIASQIIKELTTIRDRYRKTAEGSQAGYLLREADRINALIKKLKPEEE